MRDLVITENITLDGVIDAAGDWFSAANDINADQSDVDEASREQSGAPDAVLLGSLPLAWGRGVAQVRYRTDASVAAVG